MSLLWWAFVLLVIAALVGAWCILSTTLDGGYWRSMNDPTPTEKGTACIGALVLLAGAAGFAVAALLKGG
jgi:hypothetical protein